MPSVLTAAPIFQSRTNSRGFDPSLSLLQAQCPTPRTELLIDDISYSCGAFPYREYHFRSCRPFPYREQSTGAPISIIHEIPQSKNAATSTFMDDSSIQDALEAFDATFERGQLLFIAYMEYYGFLSIRPRHFLQRIHGYFAATSEPQIQMMHFLNPV